MSAVPSINVAPILADVDVTDRLLAAPVKRSNFALAKAGGEQSLDLAYLLDGKDCAARALSSVRNAKAGFKRVALVMRSGAPFKIAHAVVRFVAVYVIDLRQSCRIGDEGDCNQAMNVRRRSSAAIFQADRQVPIAGCGRIENATRDSLLESPDASSFASFAGCSSIERPHSSEARNLVDAFVARYISPFFNHWVECTKQPALKQGHGLCLPC